MNVDVPDRSLVFERSKPGWFRVTHPDNHDLAVYVTGRVQDTGDVLLTAVLLDSPKGARAADMRSLPLARIAAELGRTHNAAWLQEGDQAYNLDELEAGVHEEKPPYARPLDFGRRPVRRPDGSDPAAFLASVAEAYRELYPKTKKVALAIAAEADVPPATARRWIYDARRRGLLTEGGRGKG